jgi:3-hydroxyacyl-[acyl-carrier-protein] dehydratase
MRFILIDELIEISKGGSASARKVFDESETVFADHFPGFPIVPGVLLSEAMSQTAGWLLLYSLDFGTWPLLNMIQSAKFRRPVAPGDELLIEARIDRIEAGSSRVRSSVSVGGGRVADATLVFRHMDLFDEGEKGVRLREWMRATWQSLTPRTVVTE